MSNSNIKRRITEREKSGYGVSDGRESSPAYSSSRRHTKSQRVGDPLRCIGGPGQLSWGLARSHTDELTLCLFSCKASPSLSNEPRVCVSPILR